MTLRREYRKEIMDDFSITDNRIDDALDELSLINKFLGGNLIFKRAFKYLINTSRKSNAASASKYHLSVLDVGAGGAEYFYILNNKAYQINWINIDLNIRACRYEKNRQPGNYTVCSNALYLPFKDKAFDVVHASLFLHHFKENDIIRLLQAFMSLSRQGIVINDLRRNILAYLGIKLLTALFSRSQMVKNDGPLSVKRGFIKTELVKFLQAAGIKKYIIKRKWAFRWMIIIPVSETGV